jgi:hypothetical protein
MVLPGQVDVWGLEQSRCGRGKEEGKLKGLDPRCLVNFCIVDWNLVLYQPITFAFSPI